MAPLRWIISADDGREAKTPASIAASACPAGDDPRLAAPLFFSIAIDEELGVRSSPSPVRAAYAYLPPNLCVRLLGPSAGGGSAGAAASAPPLRVILALHGYSGRPIQALRKWHDAASSLEAAIFTPQGTPTPADKDHLGWNAIDCCGDPVKNNINDVGFILGATGAFLREMGGANVIATGFSNGGFLTSLVGLLPGDERPDWLVGIVPTGGYQYDPALYGAGRDVNSESNAGGPDPLPVFMHHAGRDAVVRPEGCCRQGEGDGSICPLDIGIAREECTSVEEAYAMWSHINGCRTTVEDHIAGDDPDSATCRLGVGCAASARYCSWTKEGHNWGYRFPGSNVTAAWMKEVFHDAEARGNPVGNLYADRGTSGSIQSHPRQVKGRRLFSMAAAVLVASVLVLYGIASKFFVCSRGRKGGRRKRKISEEEQENMGEEMEAIMLQDLGKKGHG